MKCVSLAVLFWAVAAALVLTANYWIEPVSPALDTAAKACALVLAAAGYIRLCAQRATFEHALLVGAAWIVLAIVVEVYEASATGRGWFDLIGSPEHPVERAFLLLAWVGAPSLFVRTSA